MRRTISDVAIEHDKCWAAFGLLEDTQCVLNAIDIIGVSDAQHVPAIGEETRCNIFREGNAGVAFNRDVVVVPDPAEAIEPKVSRQRRGLGRYAFHHAAVAADGVNLVVKDVVSRPVITGGQPLLRDCHTYARGYALPQRARRCFHTRDPVIFGMARSFAAELPKTANVIERYGRLPEPFVIGVYGLYTREMQNRPQQHR